VPEEDEEEEGEEEEDMECLTAKRSRSLKCIRLS